MKKINKLTVGFLFFLLPFVIFADQTLTTRLQQIERLLDCNLKKWFYSTPENKIEKKYYVGRSISEESITFLTEFKKKKYFAGVNTQHNPAFLDLTVYSRGLSMINLYVDGKLLKKFLVDGSKGFEEEKNLRIKIPETKDIQHIIKVKVNNKGFKPERIHYWPPRDKPLKEEGIYFGIRKAKIIYENTSEIHKKLSKWLLSMKTAHILINPEFVRYTFTGKPFEIEDKRKTSKEQLNELNRILKKTVFELDIDALQKGSHKQVLDSVQKSYSIAKPLRKYAKEFKVYLIGNAHIDIAWLWRKSETVEVARNTYKTVVQNMKEYPELIYAQSQALTYKWIEEKYPDLFNKIKERIKDGRWEVVGGMWVEPDCNLIGGESWVRQILYGKKYFKKNFGIDINIGWNPDSFGYNWNIPQIYRKSGIDFFITQKIWWNDTTVFPYFTFWWKGVDGTKLLTYFPPVGYTSRVKLLKIADAITKYEATTGYKKSMVLYGIGDHGGGPNREILDRVRSYKDLFVAPEFIHSKSIKFLKNMKNDIEKSIPEWNDELYLQYHRGTYTTQAKIKKNNRKAESRLSYIEKLASISNMFDFEYPYSRLEKAWKLILTNQFHDILPGSSITPVYPDALEDYKRAYKIINYVEKKAAENLVAKINTSKIQGTPVVVYNPLSWDRNGVVKATIKKTDKSKVKALDFKGNEIPCDVKFNELKEKATVSFIANKVPALGYRVYSIKQEPSNLKTTDLKVNGYTLENKFYRIKLDSKTGNLVSIFDKTNNKEFIEKGKQANILKIYEDRPENWDAWNIGYTGRYWELNKVDEIKIIKITPVKIVAKIKKSFLGLSKNRYSPTEDYPSSFFTQYITLYNNIKRIDIITHADWWEDHMFLKAEFPVSVTSDYANYEIPYASIKRSTKLNTLEQKAEFETSALRWVNLSDNEKGISILSDSKYGYDIHSNIMKISLLRSPKWPDEFADRGKHKFTYSIYTHENNWNNSETVKKAQELNIPLVAIETKHHKGELPEEMSFFEIESDGVILDTIKKSEDGKGFILRLYQSKNKNEDISLKLFKKPSMIFETNLMEKNIKPLYFKGKSLTLKFSKYEIKTIKIIF